MESYGRLSHLSTFPDSTSVLTVGPEYHILSRHHQDYMARPASQERQICHHVISLRQSMKPVDDLFTESYDGLIHYSAFLAAYAM